jgi:hypothetical protein
VAPFILYFLVLQTSQQDSKVDEDCENEQPTRCGDGVCRKDCKEQPMIFPAFCHSFSKNYQCNNGSCTSSYSECLSMSGATISSRAECKDKSKYRPLTQTHPVQRRLLQSQLLRPVLLELQHLRTSALRRRKVRQVRIPVRIGLLSLGKAVPLS